MPQNIVANEQTHPVMMNDIILQEVVAILNFCAPNKVYEAKKIDRATRSNA